MTYASLARRAARVASSIESLQAEGAPVLLVLPTGPAFLDVFWGCVWAGRIPAPLPVPRLASSFEEHATRIARCAERSGNAPIVTTSALAAALGATRAGKGLRFIDAESLGGGAASSGRANRIAMIQFSSGSLGDPKGVMLSHAAIAADIAGIVARQGGHADDVAVTWVPLVHDMGLIGGHLSSVFLGCEQVIMPTERFIMSPASWMQAVHEHRGTYSAGPPFGFALATRRGKPNGLDLRSLRTCVTGAEPIDASVLRAFVANYASAGLSQNVCAPGYGLAECCVAVTAPIVSEPLRTVRVARGLEPGRPVELVREGEGLELVTVGTALDGLVVEVHREDGSIAPEHEVGDIHVKGHAVFDGYWNDAAATAAALKNGWLVTGDLGFVHDGQLVIAGRRKDVIILRGRHYFPEEIEGVVATLDGVRERGVVAFGLVDPSGGPERVVIVAETDARGDAAEGLRRRIEEAVADALECPVDDTLFVKPRAIPRTPSGKLRRSEARRLWGSTK